MDTTLYNEGAKVRRVAEAVAKEADRMRAVALRLDKLALQMLREMEE
jgi:hypothetical protein